MIFPRGVVYIANKFGLRTIITPPSRWLPWGVYETRRYIWGFMQTQMPQYVSNLRFHFDVLVQDCSNSSALAMELLQSCAKPSISYLPYTKLWVVFKMKHEGWFWWINRLTSGVICVIARIYDRLILVHDTSNTVVSRNQCVCHDHSCCRWTVRLNGLNITFYRPLHFV